VIFTWSRKCRLGQPLPAEGRSGCRAERGWAVSGFPQLCSPATPSDLRWARAQGLAAAAGDWWDWHRWVGSGDSPAPHRLPGGGTVKLQSLATSLPPPPQ